ncbi:hypothetical protein M406DRAFT_249345 [Cryphonectria parasitica EP155]|uniref:DUF7587 domain-containing protein n=1 Tax=Cryphonectria parasitica (strain ATCC 38755 / EP155) TaxID=660469 RepID=A0A9P5CT26_CRYP1|nr:uncharacterized protein M406DRAFT_249345 [Cryphonectria parasitica EP155]KAF3768710.1 hypothetical protein M406DRAFT_249345 [Cryphonectria parasitica EP155]
MLFNPPQSKDHVRDRFRNIPRYLLRVVSPRSVGANDTTWIRSDSAEQQAAHSTVDLFAMRDDEAAAMINAHLRWEGGYDNLVSWTSSQLFAIQYMLWLHTARGCSTSAIKLFVLDTSALPAGVFLRDIDLLEAYHEHSPRLDDLYILRRRRHKNYQGYFYFGEYLSQGCLNIEGRVQVVSLAALLENGLSTLRPEFADMSESRRGLANQVIAMREAFLYPPRLITENEARAVIRLSELFEPSWRLPMAAYFLALWPRTLQDGDMINMFSNRLMMDSYSFRLPYIRVAGLTDTDKQSCSELGTKVWSCAELPEVTQFEVIIRAIYEEFVATKTLGTF